MSKYYDVSKPYSIENWNDLIKDVNEILENPPYFAEDDEECQPIPPIEEVEDPHVWKIKDVVEMQDKLIETCPDIEFEDFPEDPKDPTELWRRDIIDEIVEKFEEAWCDCEGEPEESEVVVCTHTQTLFEAGPSPNQCCGTVHGSVYSPCDFPNHEVKWTGETAPVPQLDGEAIGDAYMEGYHATFAFIGFINELPGMAKDIREKQAEIDEYVAVMQAYISKFDSDCKGVDLAHRPDHCPITRQKICEFDKKARDAQDELEDLIDEFAEKRAEAMDKFDEANSAAVSSQSGALSLQGRFSPDVNVVSDCYADAVPYWPWWEWWDPTSMPIIGDERDWVNNLPSMKGNGVLVSVSGWKIGSNYNPPRPSISHKYRISPNGTWFIWGTSAVSLVRNYTLPWQTQSTRFKCFGIFEISCPDGICEWEPWEDQKWYWNQGWGTGFGSWVWQPLPPHENPITEVWHLRKLRLQSVKDVSEKRDEWLDLYSSTEEWYKEHEKYDGEQADWYCGG